MRQLAPQPCIPSCGAHCQHSAPLSTRAAPCGVCWLVLQAICRHSRPSVATLTVSRLHACVRAPNPVLLRLIFTLREYPTTEDFVYLRRFKRWPADCNPYALEVVQFWDIDQANYYTMSVRGITHYIDGVNAEFASEHTCATCDSTATWLDVQDPRQQL